MWTTLGTSKAACILSNWRGTAPKPFHQVATVKMNYVEDKSRGQERLVLVAVGELSNEHNAKRRLTCQAAHPGRTSNEACTA